VVPVVANCNTEHLELAESTAVNEPTHWYMYVDDKLFVWPHAKEILQKCLRHLKGTHQNTEFTGS
jgi:hypothetical protein